MDGTPPKLVRQSYSYIYGDDNDNGTKKILQTVEKVEYIKELRPPDSYLNFMEGLSYKLTPDSINFIKNYGKKEKDVPVTPKRRKRPEEVDGEGGGTVVRPRRNSGSRSSSSGTNLVI
jgi:hypothetical protein